MEYGDFQNVRRFGRNGSAQDVGAQDVGAKKTFFLGPPTVASGPCSLHSVLYGAEVHGFNDHLPQVPRSTCSH